MIHRKVNPVLLDRALFKFLDERLEIHAQDLRAGGANNETISQGVERYRGQLLEQLLKMVIRNGPEWFGGRKWRAMLDTLPSSSLSH